MKVIKWIIGTLLAFVLLLAIGLAYIVLAIDPNSYKPQLAELAQEQDIALNIAGDLSWQLLPSLVLSIGATDITSPRAEIPALSFEQADLSLAWLPLFKRQLSIKAIHLEGADIRLGTAEQASNTALAPLAAAPSAKQADNAVASADTSTAPPAFSLAIERLEISNSRLQLPPTAEASSPQQLSDITLLIHGLNLDGEEFKLKASFNYSDPALPQPMAVQLDTKASVEQNSQTFTLSKTVLELLLADKPPVELSLDSLTAGRADGSHLKIAGLVLNSAGASLQASLSAQSVDDRISFKSDIKIPPLALRKALSDWAIDLPDLPDKQALQQAGLQMSIKGSNEQLSISSLKLTLDDITIDGSTDVSFGSTRSVALQLHSSPINLNRYISSTDEGEATDTTQASVAPKAEPELIFAPLVAPLLWVGDGNASLDISLDGLTIDNIAAEKVQIKIQAANNIVQIKQLAAQVFDGDINTTATINLQHKEPRVNFTSVIKALAVDKALIAVNGEAALTGNLRAKLQGKTRGNNAEQLHQHLNANGEINLARPYLKAFNIEKSYCDIAALIEKTARKADWPQGSQLQDVQAKVHLSGKQVILQSYSTGLGNISLSGKGVIDLDKERFDLLAISRLNGDHTSEQGCLVKSKRVRDKDIPIRCKDSFANAGGGSCKPDGDFVKQVLQDKLLDALQKKSNNNGESEEALKGLLKGLFGR